MPRRQDESYEEGTLQGPFQGICSELPADQVGDVGFLDCLNMFLFRSAAVTRPGTLVLPQLPSSPGTILNVGLGSTVGGGGIASVVVGKNVYWWTGSAWTTVTGPNLDIGVTGATFQPGVALVGNFFCFCHGSGSPVAQGWNVVPPAAGTYAALSGSAVQALVAFEFDNRLVLGNTGGNFSSGTASSIVYTNSQDPTDFTSVNAGSYAVPTDIGPIFGLARIYQMGYAFCQMGIEQMQLTGNGLSPFYLSPFGSTGKGMWYFGTLSKYGDEGAVYVGQENVFFFDGTESVPIGDRPLSNNKFKGAWSAISAEITGATAGAFFSSAITTSVGNNPFKCYWLSIPGKSIWIYNFKEENWTRTTYTFTGGGNTVVNCLSQFIYNINSGQPAFAIGSSDGFINVIQPSQALESGQAWSISSGSMSFMDRRHNKHVNRLRICYLDTQVNTTISVTFMNEKGISQTQNPTFGTASGIQQAVIVPINIQGLFLKWIISGTNANPMNISEIATYYEEGSEYKNT